MKYLTILVMLLLTACASTTNTQETDPAKDSGYLSDYTILKEIDTTDDSALRRFISKEIKTRGYNKILIDPISYYPTPQVTDTISKDALSNISNYFNTTLRRAIAEKITVVNEPGQQTLRMKMVITGVQIADKKLAIYQYIPIAFLVNAAKGGMKEVVVHVQIEAELVDSLSGELMASAVKSGVGETLKDDKSVLTLEQVKPLIDSWAKTMKKTIENNL